MEEKVKKLGCAWVLADDTDVHLPTVIPTGPIDKGPPPKIVGMPLKEPIFMFKSNYVDDSRSGCRVFPPGTRFDEAMGQFTRKKSDLHKDIQGNQDLVLLTQVEFLKALNSISKNLNLTLEDFEDFMNGWLPTLDFELRVSDKRLFFRFFEKTHEK